MPIFLYIHVVKILRKTDEDDCTARRRAMRAKKKKKKKRRIASIQDRTGDLRISGTSLLLTEESCDMRPA